MNALNISVIGQSGQLARALASCDTSSQHNIVCYGRKHIDLSSHHDEIYDFIADLGKTDVVINAAAYTAVDQAEDDKETAFKVNADAPGSLAEICAKKNIPFIHISTDYVFNGQKTSPYKVGDLTAPLGVYGASKRAGEENVLAAGGLANILRTSWVYDGTGKNFFTTMMHLGQDREELNVVSDQFGRPTYAKHLAVAAIKAAETLSAGLISTSGIFHVSNTGAPIHWADFAQAIFTMTDSYRPHNVIVNKITSAEYPTRAKRPNYSVLDVSNFEKTFQMKLPSWHKGLMQACAEWVQAQK